MHIPGFDIVIHYRPAVRAQQVRKRMQSYCKSQRRIVCARSPNSYDSVTKVRFEHLRCYKETWSILGEGVNQLTDTDILERIGYQLTGSGSKVSHIL